MPRPKKPGAPEPKRRSRNGCWPCKRRRIKCTEERPACGQCIKSSETCDYSLRLNWNGREKRSSDDMLTPNALSTSTGSQRKRLKTGLLAPFDATSRSSSSPHIHSESDPHTLSDRRPASADTLPTSTVLHPPLSTNRPRSTQCISVENARSYLGMHGQAGSSFLDARREMAMPLTPNTPGIQYMPPFAPPVDQDAEYHADTDRRKLSIRSLLAQPSTCMDDDRNYGFDQGRRDIDLPRNDDANALIAFSPSATLRKLDFSPEDGVRADEVDDMLAQSRDLDDPELDASAYYSNSVPVTIPTALEPLPDVLSNPMNLLYFHHFLNHTARLLVLHDCHYNVLRHVLPQSELRSAFRSI